MQKWSYPNLRYYSDNEKCKKSKGNQCHQHHKPQQKLAAELQPTQTRVKQMGHSHNQIFKISQSTTLPLWTHSCLFTNLLNNHFKQTDYAGVVFAHTI